MNVKILTLMQFARKAGRLSAGMDACERALKHQNLRLIIVAADSSERTKTSLKRIMGNLAIPVKLIETGTKQELSVALGLPETGIFGISEKNFAAKIFEYWQAEA